MPFRFSAALLVSAFLVCMVAACGARDEAPHDALLDASIELPRIARYGMAPPADGRVTIAVTAEGRVVLDDGAHPLEDLAAALRGRLGPVPGWGGEDGTSMDEEIIEAEEETEEVVVEEVVVEADAADPKRTVAELPPRDPVPAEEDRTFRPFVRPTDVLLHIDRRAPYAAVDGVLRACVHMDVRLVRLFIAVRGEDGGRGAVASFLPMDRGCAGKTVAGIDVDVRLRPASAADPDEALAEALALRRESPEDALFVIAKVTPATRWSAVVDLMDEALAAGAYALVFHGMDYKLRDVPMARWIDEAQGHTGYAAALRRGVKDVSSLRDDRPAGGTHEPQLVDRGQRSAYFGFSNAVSMAGEELIDEELEAIDDRRWIPVRGR